jgi:hypothetical protein
MMVVFVVRVLQKRNMLHLCARNPEPENQLFAVSHWQLAKCQMTIAKGQ